MTEGTPNPPPPDGDPAARPVGGQAHLLATGSLVQQISQVTGLLALFAVLTVLARRLSLSELGVYGLLSSLAGYLLVLQNAAASAAVRNMAAATTDAARSEAFSTAAVIYAAAGALTGVALTLIGVVLAEAIDLTPALRDDARLGAAGLGLITALGWPLTIFRDVLRASQRFTRAALMDIVGLVLFAALVLGLAFGDAPLWALIAASGTIPMFAGAASLLTVLGQRSAYRFRREAVTRTAARDFARLGAYVSAQEAASVVIYALDRVILGLFRSAATVGLYEGPVRVHNLVRAINGALNVTVLPSAARYIGEGDDVRLRALFLRGSRYALAVIVPITVTLMAVAEPLLEVWLGPRYGEGATALAILVSYWLVSGSIGIAGSILIAAGRARTLARYAWTMALGNLAFSLALTPLLGLEGVALGTTIPYAVMFPFVLRLVLDVVGLSLGEVARKAWLPSYVIGAGLALALVAARLTLDLYEPAVLVAVAGAALTAAWAAFYLFAMDEDERALVRSVAAGMVPRRRV